MGLNPYGNVTALSGVGPKTQAELRNLGIETCLDLLLHLPIRYQDRSKITPIDQLLVGEEALIEGTIVSTSLSYRGRRSLECIIQDEEKEMTLRFFFFNKHQQAALTQGTWIRAFGAAKQWGKSITMIHPEYKTFRDKPDSPDQKLTPVYSLTKGITQNKLRGLAVSMTKLEWPQEGGVPYQKLKTLHSPPNKMNLREIEELREEVALDELTAHYILTKQRSNERMNQIAKPLPRSIGLGKKLLAQLGFSLTLAQARVTKEILLDLEKPYPMLRLLQGDVGSGKTIIAAFAAIRAIEQGNQAALLAPTELLAEQHFNNFREWLGPLNIRVCVLTGKTSKKVLTKMLDQIENGDWDLVIGTHAIFQERVTFRNLVLTLIDEQHRFGVHQRMALLKKAPDTLSPHQLIMTATPIPRTLTMALYGDMDVSIIDELPKGRKPIQTKVIDSEEREFLYEKVHEAVNRGHQVYWVCTLIEESDSINANSAIQVHQELLNLKWRLRIGLLHGQLSSQEKSDIMSAFKNGELDVLVSTTIVEVGVDVPNATLMVIENASRLGLAQLHQLRGRIGRGHAASDCVLLSQASDGLVSKQRLAAMNDSQDGFFLAEQDLKIRGPGDVLGTRQSGEESFRLVDLATHSHLISRAIERGESLLRSETIDAKQEIIGLLSTWNRKQQQLLRA
mgnify:FL=1